MGKSITPKYKVDMTDNTSKFDMSWNVTGSGNRTAHGKPTPENLEKYVHSYAKSLEIGGVNEHISLNLGHIPYPSSAKIVNQFTGEVVAEWKAGMFQVW